MTSSRRASSEDLRHLLLMEELERHGNVSQRELARRLGWAASVVNRLIGELIDGEHIEVRKRNVRPFAYDLTPAGEEYRRRLSHHHYRSVLGDYRDVEQRIRRRLRGIREQGLERLVFYGAGEIMDVTFPVARAEGLEVVALVDDDPEKQGSTRGDLEVRCPEVVDELEPDGVLITTFRHADEIRQRMSDELDPAMPVFEL